MKHEWAVIPGGRAAVGRIAFALVHPRARIDVAFSDVLLIEALEEITFALPGGVFKTFTVPRVEVTLAPRARSQLRQLTAAIVGEAMDIVVSGRVVSSPIVREPLGRHPTFTIKLFDLAEAEALAAKLRQGWDRPALRVV